MERLTQRLTNCDYCALSDCTFRSEELAEENKCIIFNCTSRDRCFDKNVYERLKYYEDLEEDGKLMIVPCKKGDTVYVICTKCMTLTECGDEYDCRTCNYDLEYVIDKRIVTKDLLSLLTDVTIPNLVYGKNVFLNYDDAELALKNKTYKQKRKRKKS